LQGETFKKNVMDVYKYLVGNRKEKKPLGRPALGKE